MKRSSFLVSILVLFFGLGIAYADCGSGHEKKNPHNMGRIANTGFEDMDTDKSGTVSFDEFKSKFPRTSQAGFNMLDKDGDAQLNAAEWDAFKDAHKGMGGYHKGAQTT